ncbi:MAG: methionine biosynthesis protein MetW [Armatimonadetes bacterium]|nr:methionine biosynthesis protein MetW [Armatimonadota bacterium]
MPTKQLERAVPAAGPASEGQPRGDLDLILRLIPRGAHVLDLGCGDGLLLQRLRREKGADGRGVERHPEALLACIRRGIPVFQGDLDEGLADFPDKSFDVVVISHTLQQVSQPRRLLREAGRVGRQVIVGFPNFGHWEIRFGLLLRGRMPKSPMLPYEWYDTPNIHLLTLADFEEFCRREGLRVEQRLALRYPTWRPVRFCAGWLAAYALYLLDARDFHPAPVAPPAAAPEEEIAVVEE